MPADMFICPKRHSIRQSRSADNKLEFQIGQPLPEKRNDPLLESADAYIHFVKLHFKMLQAVVESKERFDAAQSEREAQEV